MSRKYRLAVFDLDFTVWDAGGVWSDCLLPPFRVKGGQARAGYVQNGFSRRHLEQEVDL